MKRLGEDDAVSQPDIRLSYFEAEGESRITPVFALCFDEDASTLRIHAATGYYWLVRGCIAVGIE